MSPSSSSRTGRAVRPDRYRLGVGAVCDLGTRSARDRSGYDGTKSEGRQAILDRCVRLGELQEMLHATGRHRVLCLLQGMDASGKDGVVRRVLHAVHPAGARVAGFCEPTAEELAHDYLWRVHAQAPAAGELVLFNRSHYEDVVTTRAEGLVGESVWRRRYGHIRDFERLLVEEGTVLVKVFLHVSFDEQRRRLAARATDPTRQWKLTDADVAHRGRWAAYQSAYEEALCETSTPWAPWHVVPADRKWYRDLMVVSLLVDALERLGLHYPPSSAGPDVVARLLDEGR